MDKCANLPQLLSATSSYGQRAQSLIAMSDPATIVRMSDILEREQYASLKMARRAAHVGQFKLQWSEIQFLTFCARNISRESLASGNVYVIYAGSGPGHSRQNLANMFPGMKFILIDPQEHDIKGCDPRSKLYFRSARPRSEALARESIDFAVRDDSSSESTTYRIKRCAKKDVPATSESFLNPSEIAETIARERGYTFYIIEDLFTDDLARAFARFNENGCTSLFISDIRTNFELPDSKPRAKPSAFVDEEADADESPSDLDILVNNMWQHIWSQLLHPAQCMLKFRPPFMNPRDIALVRAKSAQFADLFARYTALFGVDLLAEYEEKHYWFMANDHIDIQVFAGPTSTETRLVAGPEHYDRVIQYDPRDHEERMFYYNMMREFCFYERNRPFFDAKIGLDGCADCNLALHIAREYIRNSASVRVNVEISSPGALIAQSLNNMHRTLHAELHGSITRAYTSLREAADRIISATISSRTYAATHQKRAPRWEDRPFRK